MNSKCEISYRRRWYEATVVEVRQIMYRKRFLHVEVILEDLSRVVLQLLLWLLALLFLLLLLLLMLLLLNLPCFWAGLFDTGREGGGFCFALSETLTLSNYVLLFGLVLQQRFCRGFLCRNRRLFGSGCCLGCQRQVLACFSASRKSLVLPRLSRI